MTTPVIVNDGEVVRLTKSDLKRCLPDEEVSGNLDTGNKVC